MSKNYIKPTSFSGAQGHTSQNASLAYQISSHPSYAYEESQYGRKANAQLLAVVIGKSNNIQTNTLRLMLGLLNAGQTFQLTCIIKSGPHSDGNAFDAVILNNKEHGFYDNKVPEWQDFIDVIDSIVVGWDGQLKLGLPNLGYESSTPNVSRFLDTPKTTGATGIHLHVWFG